MRKNVAGQFVSFMMLSTAAGVKVTTGLPVVYVTIDNGAQATGTGIKTNKGNGEWSYAASQAETNGDRIAFSMELATAISQTVNVFPAFPQTLDNDTKISLVDTVVDGIQTDLSNATDGLSAIKGDTAATLAEIGVAGAGLTAINLPNQTMDITGSLSGSVGSVTGHTPQTADHATSIASILADTSITIDTKLNDIQGATFSSATDSLEAVRNQGDAAWITGGGGGTDRLLLADTTIATLTSQTSFTLSAGSADDGAYNNCTAVIENATTAVQKAVGVVSGYIGVSKTITLKYDPSVFIMAPTDKVYILAENSVKSVDINRQLKIDAVGNAHADVTEWSGGAVSGTSGIPDVNTQSINANAVNAAAIAVSALDGKGDWNIGKTGFSLSTAGILAIWHQLLTGITTLSTIGKLIKDFLDAAISSRNSITPNTVTPPTVAAIRTEIDANSTKLDVAVSTRNSVIPNTVIPPTILELNARTILSANYATSAKQDTAQIDLDDIQTRLPAVLISGRMDSNIEAINNDVTAANNLSKSALGIVIGSATGVPTTSVIDSDLTEATTDHYKGRILTFTSGTVAGQSTDITGYNGTTKELTVTPLTNAPSSGDTFTIN